MEKKTLCLNCEYGLVREWEWSGQDSLSGYSNRCLLGNDFVEVITSCNRYKKKVDGKITYSDPDFEEYECSVENGG